MSLRVQIWQVSNDFEVDAKEKSEPQHSVVRLFGYFSMCCWCWLWGWSIHMEVEILIALRVPYRKPKIMVWKMSIWCLHRCGLIHHIHHISPLPWPFEWIWVNGDEIQKAVCQTGWRRRKTASSRDCGDCENSNSGRHVFVSFEQLNDKCRRPLKLVTGTLQIIEVGEVVSNMQQCVEFCCLCFF